MVSEKDFNELDGFVSEIARTMNQITELLVVIAEEINIVKSELGKKNHGKRKSAKDVTE